MKLCRFGDNRLGVYDDTGIKDVTPALAVVPALNWPVPPGGQLIQHLPDLPAAVRRLQPQAPRVDAATLDFLSPIANPSEIVAAPLNYTKHVDEVGKDPTIHAGTRVFDFDGSPTPIDKLRVFLKANTSIVGPGRGIELTYPERRIDHEVEPVAVIGREARNVVEDEALDIVCGYCIGLDMTVRGPEDCSFPKSPDGYTVLGPVFATADEIADPEALDFSITVNGDIRQASNTRYLTIGIRRLIAIASPCYTLYPGDVIMTGTPSGVGPVAPGDRLAARIDGLRDMQMRIMPGAAPAAVHGRPLERAAQ